MEERWKENKKSDVKEESNYNGSINKENECINEKKTMNRRRTCTKKKFLKQGGEKSMRTRK